MSVNLSTTIKRAALSHELLSIARHAIVAISPLGTRTITVPRYHGSASVDALAERVMELVDQRQLDGRNYTEDEYISGYYLSAQIDTIYRQLDDKYEEANLMTKVCISGRDLSYGIYLVARNVSTLVLNLLGYPFGWSVKYLNADTRSSWEYCSWKPNENDTHFFKWGAYVYYETEFHSELEPFLSDTGHAKAEIQKCLQNRDNSMLRAAFRRFLQQVDSEESDTSLERLVWPF